ncbi:hypothetical protein CYY_000631 [Polysphondylium violaceum]|uniref:Uncharacterized protein n=1 Tax=Polysphondylium violaceum TaxID=133409 RepID=A0A8J4Q2H4_9MYCE|nr:hypothetical protein CYY_000631 [Polysphondylium violaceum]
MSILKSIASINFGVAQSKSSNFFNSNNNLVGAGKNQNCQGLVGQVVSTVDGTLMPVAQTVDDILGL